MTTIESILSSDRTRCHVPAHSKKRVLEILAELIAGASEELTTSMLFERLVARERLGSTGIGNGIAIPHCRCSGLTRAIGALITLEKGVDFDAVDSAPVDVVFAMLVPEDGAADHLKLLAALAEALQDPTFVASLRRAETPEQLFSAARVV